MPSPVLQVRLSRAELEALDRRATALGVRRSDLVRRLLTQGLAAEGAPVTMGDPFTLEPPPPVEPWHVVAQRLEFEHPERWALPDVFGSE
jgi:Ribbon-helix-helix protein, copG family